MTDNWQVQDEDRPRVQLPHMRGASDAARAQGRHLVDVHDHYRRELIQLRAITHLVAEGRERPEVARQLLHELSPDDADHAFMGFCAQFCRIIEQHHRLEDGAMFPALRERVDGLDDVLDQLQREHLLLHDIILHIDELLVRALQGDLDVPALTNAVDSLTDLITSHFRYEEEQLVPHIEQLADAGTSLFG